MVLRVLCEITLPLDDGLVPLSLDGQSLRFNVDSAASETFAVYGDWYEKKYGPGACNQLRSGCYFCSDPRLCEDVYQRRRWKITFAHGRENVTVVLHQGKLSIGNSLVHSFTFGLAIGYESIFPDNRPDGLIGLSFPGSTLPISLLQQLKDSHIIDDLTFSIMPGQGYGLSGMLSLGSRKLSSGKLERALFAPPGEGKAREFLVDLVRVKIVNREGKALMVNNIRSASSKPVVQFDTGDDCIQVSLSNLRMIIENTRDCAEHDESVIWWDSNLDYWLIREDAIRCLPSVVYRIKANDYKFFNVVIKPQHYTSWCDKDGCILHLRHSKDSDLLVLGYPFFTAYQSFFNLSGGWIDTVMM